MKNRPTEIKAGGYSVFIGGSLLVHLKKFLSQPGYKDSSVFVLCDENTMTHCYPFISDLLGTSEIIIIPAGEEHKSIEVCKSIWEALSERKADRKSVVINLGGGMVSDIGGFAASTFKRGIDFINLPTTLLAQVDAAVGGKTGIDLNHVKNEVGVFNFPKGVFIFTKFLETLAERQLNSGFAEVIKHALIADRKYWNEIKKFDAKDGGYAKLILRSVEIKAKIAKADPKEKGQRKILNFGHTIGHALETFSLEGAGEMLLHGEAVAAGMVCEAYLSHRKLKLSKDELSDITSFIFTKYKQVKLDKFDEHRLVELMKHDKKNSKGEINFTLLRKIGFAEYNKTVSIDLIKEALNYYRNVSS